MENLKPHVLTAWFHNTHPHIYLTPSFLMYVYLPMRSVLVVAASMLRQCVLRSDKIKTNDICICLAHLISTHFHEWVIRKEHAFICCWSSHIYLSFYVRKFNICICSCCVRGRDTAYIPRGGCLESILMVSFKENSRRRTGFCFKLINDRMRGWSMASVLLYVCNKYSLYASKCKPVATK